MPPSSSAISGCSRTFAHWQYSSLWRPDVSLKCPFMSAPERTMRSTVLSAVIVLKRPPPRVPSRPVSSWPLRPGCPRFVIGLPTTMKSAPLAMATSGVAMRRWSFFAAQAGRMPGVTIRKSEPSSSRTRLRLPRRGHDPVHARVLRALGQRQHLVHRGRHARQHRYGQDARRRDVESRGLFLARLDGRLHHLLAAHRVDVEEVDSERRSRPPRPRRPCWGCRGT